MLRRSCWQIAALAVACAAPLLSASCSSNPRVGTTQNTLTSSFVLSPDGRTVAFPKNGVIGLYDWRADQIDVIQPSAGIKSFNAVNYSPDGRKLAVVAELPVTGRNGLNQRKLGVIDLATREVALFETAKIYAAKPVFRPDGKAILYRAEQGLFLFDLGSGVSEKLLSKQDEFNSISSPSFVSNDTVLFVGMGPANPDLKRALERLGASPVTDSIPYFLQNGSKPQVAYLDFVRHQLLDRYAGLPSLMPTSRNGERVAFIGLSQSGKAREANQASGTRLYDVFVIEGGQTRQVTRLENYMSFCAISHDGSTVAFGVYPGSHSEVRRMRRGFIPLELAIVDLNTGQVTRTDFNKRIANDPRFKARKDSSLRSE